jgi:hypothetical protein
MPEESLLRLLEEGFSGCDDLDLAKRAAYNVPSDRLRALEGFILSPRDIWPLARTFVLRDGRRREALSGYLRLLYCMALVGQADDSGGVYNLDVDVVRFVTSAPPTRSRGWAKTCKILLSCRPSEGFTEWDEFLSANAESLDARDVSIAEDFIRRIHGPKLPGEQGVYDRKRRRAPHEPGIYMYGFRAPLR